MYHIHLHVSCSKYHHRRQKKKIEVLHVADTIVGSLVGVTYLRYTVLASPNKGETAVHCCDPAISVLVMLVSRNPFSGSISLAVLFALTFFQLIRSLVDPTLAALIVCGPLQYLDTIVYFHTYPRHLIVLGSAMFNSVWFPSPKYALVQISNSSRLITTLTEV